MKALVHFFVIAVFFANAQNLPSKKVEVFFTNKPPKIDGFLDDECWKDSTWQDDFLQKTPFYGQQPSQKTFFSATYNNEGIFFAIKCLDTEPEKILRQVGKRDDDLNADFVNIQIDPYLTYVDAYVFQVYASNTQLDYRFSDGSFNAIWKSATLTHDSGWNAEIFIPFSALRFPKKPEQTWGLQVQRSIRRNRELSQWSLEEQNAQQAQRFWGILTGIRHIYPPIRFSLHPYASISWQSENNSSFLSYSGGLDLKWGINESYTLDLTLLPDFSQAPSDKLIKNLSAFETYYPEQRDFFKEGIELFTRAGLFYSRRIGKTPSGYYSIFHQIDSTDRIIENPSQVPLLNAFKISGRSKNGLATGIFNAYTQSTYAIIEHADGQREKILTEPATNYNIMVLDKQWSSGNSLYVINTNTYRPGHYYKSNVTATGGNYYFSQNRFRLFAQTAISIRDTITSLQVKSGHAHSVNVSKVRGNWQFSLGLNKQDSIFHYNDLGLQYKNDFHETYANSSYIWFNPCHNLRYISIGGNVFYQWKTSVRKLIENSLNFRFNLLTLSFFSFWFNAWKNVFPNHDFYEPRMNGWFIIWSPAYGFSSGFSTSYVKPFAFDGNMGYSYQPEFHNRSFSVYLSPLFNLGNHFKARLASQISTQSNDIGFVTHDPTPIFGKRNLITYENSISCTYTFINNFQLAISLRHYINTGKYAAFYQLENSGKLLPITTFYEADYQFNYLSIDMFLNYEFMPGSYFVAAFKPKTLLENKHYQPNYIAGLENVLHEPWSTLFNLKLMLYLDYFTTKQKLFPPQLNS